jgi:hypothetical protein
MCWSRRPGVATRMFILERRSRSSFRFFPPMTIPAEKLWYPPIDRRTSNIWTAYCRKYFKFLSEQPKRARTSSRVGDMISAPNPSCGPQLLRYKISRTGIRKHKVLPLPVRAAPRISLPFSDTGRLLACTSAISTKKAFFRPGPAFEKRCGARTNGPNLFLLDSILEDQKMLSGHLRQSSSVNYNTRVQ